MTEFEQKQSGRIYDARDMELRKQQNHAKDLMRQSRHRQGPYISVTMFGLEEAASSSRE